MDDSTKAISYFGLTKHQLRILFSLEAWMVYRDAMEPKRFIDKLNPFKAEHGNKYEWYKKFRKDTEEYLKSIEPYGVDEELYSLDDANTLIVLKKELIGDFNEDMTWKYLILLECAVFTPYYPLSNEDKENKPYKGLVWDETIREQSLKTVASILDVDEKLIEKYQKTFKTAVDEMEGMVMKLLFGGLIAAILTAIMVIPFINAIALLVAPAGLFGAAAISSGLAALGGGAIAAGGFGIIGGIAVIIGGGFLLGGGIGVGVTMAASNPKAVMFAGAKIAVAVKDIFIGQFNDKNRAWNTLKQITAQKDTIDKTILDVQAGKDVISSTEIKQKTQIDNLKESSKMLSKLIAYLRKIIGL